ncbi:MAG: TIGR02444 family protein [Geminicoccaceae bacterium]
MSELPECEFWRFSLDRYSRPGVAEACLELQDRDGADVNLLLLAMWLGSLGRRLSPAEGARLTAIAADWQNPIVAPLRAVRRCLKERIDVPWAEALEVWRRRVAEAELALEQVEQLLLERAAGAGLGCAPRMAAAQENLAALGLARVLGTPQLERLLAEVGQGDMADR